MAKKPAREQRLIIEAADPDTGLLKGTTAQLEALVVGRWAFRHPTPPHRCYLTPAGWQLRKQLLQPQAALAAPREAPGFAARKGDEMAPEDSTAREREVRSAWAGLLELRRMSNRTGSSRIPCPWELTNPMAAVGLALEAAGCAPSEADRNGCRTASGYLLSAWPQAATVQVTRAVPKGEPQAGASGLKEALSEYAHVLDRAGWLVSDHRDRWLGMFLLASPRRTE
ncbi:hypothetical protein [Streptomyces sp. 7N604]|uniref:hypothetical protein n=1 Tax=Streptomyces sp. 7N604 TaxID=3457415 RepID=UPI003FD1B8A6